MADKPKRPLSAYMLWLNSARESIKRENPGIKVTEVAKRGGELWRAMKDKSVSSAKKRKWRKHLSYLYSLTNAQFFIVFPPFRSGRLRQPRPRTITIVPSKISRPTAAAVLPMAVPRSVRNPQRSQRKRAKRRIPMTMMMMRANRRDWSSGPSHININIYKNKKITKTNKKKTTTSSVDLSLSQSIAFCSKLYPNVPHHLQHQHMPDTPIHKRSNHTRNKTK